MQDHYTTLGVAQDASQDDIKKAYRKLAMDLHPDRNPGDKAAEDRFKQVNAAYAEIGDPNARKRYDQQRSGGGRGDPFQGGGFNFSFGFGGQPIDDIINQFFSQHGFQHHARQPRNRDFTFNLSIDLEDAFQGKEIPVQFAVGPQSYNINVTIPAGIEDGVRIRYPGHGDRSIPNAPPGDLYIQIHMNQHSRFHRNGPHLHTVMEVDALEAIVGCDRDMPCIDGHTVRVTIPPGTQGGATLRLKERGMPARASGHPRGDCLIEIKVVVPRDLTSEQMEAVRSIISARGA